MTAAATGSLSGSAPRSDRTTAFPYDTRIGFANPDFRSPAVDEERAPVGLRRARTAGSASGGILSSGLGIAPNVPTTRRRLLVGFVPVAANPGEAEGACGDNEAVQFRISGRWRSLKKGDTSTSAHPSSGPCSPCSSSRPTGSCPLTGSSTSSGVGNSARGDQLPGRLHLDLRRVLEPNRAPGQRSRVLVTQPPGYPLRVDPGDLDAARFEAAAREGRRLLAEGRPAEARDYLQDALALWRPRPR